MDRTQRIIWSDNGTLRDLSAVLNDYRRGTQVLALVGAEDKLYVASEMPFNHKYFDVSVANAVACDMSVKTWNGSEWVAAVDVIDSTKASGGTATLAQSGILSWAIDIDRSSWSCHRDSNTIPELVGTRIFNMYWVQLTFSATITATTALRYVGQSFCDDTDLEDAYPDLASSSMKASFETGKTTWREQTLAAAEAVARDLRSKGALKRRDQILRPELFLDAAVHKTAEIIYQGLGVNWRERRSDAAKSYIGAMSVKFYELDKNEDATPSTAERDFSIGYLTR